MKISDLSRLTGASTRSIRHYEKKKLIQAVRLDNNYREFDETAVERIRIIQLYLGLGLTAEQIENILGCEVAVPDQYEYCEEMVGIYREKSESIDKQIQALTVVKEQLDQQIDTMIAKRESKAAKPLLA
ncbi:MerR family transcriptional regulator [Paenibacillus arenilitoris]|uniref:MerR family transcriptional regulator n=1 Tax=Paenibacillus arenilitoris TaxID=2772299 RepID=A0A927CNG8_9BACL|nr:MerR family transcriptional regulator [Paenibacillus arenilitoris]MBD2870537.1 MerR family transcriptional regulator [Paenibacillus arenilitoris]